MEIALALGGGGSKGNAHIGILRVLEREGIRVGAIAGTSIGGLVGAVYLAGHSPDAMEAHMASLDQRHLYDRQRGEGPSLLGLGGVTEALTELLGEMTFEDLAQPFAVVAIDLHTGKEVVIREGRLIDAVLATIAVPGIFPPREWGDHMLIDGGMSNPVPVDVARSLAPGMPIVAVSLSRPPLKEGELTQPSYFRPMPVLERITRLRVAQAFNIFLRSVDISGRLLTEMRLDVDKPDFILRPKVDHIGLLDRVTVSEVVEIGEEAAEAAMEDLIKAIRWHSRLARRLGIDKLVAKVRADES